MTPPHDHDAARDNNAAQFGSSLVAMVTPMRPDGRVSQDAVTRLVDYLLAAGCDGLVVAGTTGESPTLTSAETAELITTVARRARGRARVIAGVGTSDTVHSVGQARQARSMPMGPTALLLVACRTTPGPRRPAWSRTALPWPMPPPCRSCSTTSRTARAPSSARRL